MQQSLCLLYLLSIQVVEVQEVAPPLHRGEAEDSITVIFCDDYLQPDVCAAVHLIPAHFQSTTQYVLDWSCLPAALPQNGVKARSRLSSSCRHSLTPGSCATAAPVQ